MANAIANQNGTGKSALYPTQFELDKLAVGKRIKKLREIADVSQEKLAPQIDKSRAAIGQWEIGNSYPSLSDFINLARVLKSTPEYIAFGIKPDPRKLSAPEGVKIPVMDYEQNVKTGDMIIGKDFYARLRTALSEPKITAFVLPVDGMIDHLKTGDIVFIDEHATTIEGNGECYLTPAPWNTIIRVTGKDGVWQVSRGNNGKPLEVRGAIPVVGRIVGHMAIMGV